jgi:hypothetical protein
MEIPVGCGESANHIERMRVPTDAVPVGHRILQNYTPIPTNFRRSHEEKRLASSNSRNVSLCPAFAGSKPHHSYSPA